LWRLKSRGAGVKKKRRQGKFDERTSTTKRLLVKPGQREEPAGTTRGGRNAQHCWIVDHESSHNKDSRNEKSPHSIRKEETEINIFKLLSRNEEIGHRTLEKQQQRATRSGNTQANGHKRRVDEDRRKRTRGCKRQ